jgi:hypothetical protein
VPIRFDLRGYGGAALVIGDRKGRMRLRDRFYPYAGGPIY